MADVDGPGLDGGCEVGGGGAFDFFLKFLATLEGFLVRLTKRVEMPLAPPDFFLSATT